MRALALFLMIRRPPRSTQSRSSAASDVYKRQLLISAITISSVLLPLQITKAQEKIEVIPLIQSTKGLGGKKISYPRWKQAELRFFKVVIPVGGKTPIHTHPAPMVVYLAQGELKHTRGDVINYFSSKQSLIESNNGDEHFF